MNVRLIAFLTMLLAFVAIPARAYTPPPMTAHVTDPAGKLTEAQRLAIDRKLEDYRLRTGNEIAVFIPKSLDGNDMEDVAFTTFRAWHLGAKGKDNGVLLVIAPSERLARIQTGKGVEGDLPDIRANDIIHTKIRPKLAPGHEDYDAAVDGATDAIMAALSSTGPPAPRPHARSADAGDVLFGFVFFAFMIFVPIIFVVALIRRVGSAFSSNGRTASTGWASGSSWSNDSSWSSSSNDSSWSSGGDSGFTGGGGDTGGGGSTDSF